VVGPRQLQFVEEHARELVVVVLAGVDEDLARALAKPVGDRRRLHELRPVANYGDYPHEFWVSICLDMSTFLDSVRGTVQGVLAGVCHVLWYVDWHTGGQTARRR
jgi:hypothetical protein